MASAQRPYVICHMTPSIDGRILVGGWATGATEAYEAIHDELAGDAWIIGRTSMQGYGAARKAVRKRTSTKKREDFAATTTATGYAIAIDPSGKLVWKRGTIDDDQLVMVLTESVDDAHLEHLRDVGVSYIFAGKGEIDVKLALAKLRRLFGIERLLLEGGGHINGHFLSAGVIDELSVLVAPIADGDPGVPSLFDRPTKRKGKAKPWKLVSMEKQPHDYVWLRYRL